MWKTGRCLSLFLDLLKLLKYKAYHVRQAICSSGVILCWYTYTTLGTRTIKSWYKKQIFFSTIHNLINMSNITRIINLSYNLVYLFETITLHQLCDKQQSYCICYYMNIVYLYCSSVVSIGYLRWKPSKLLELLYMLYI